MRWATSSLTTRLLLLAFLVFASSVVMVYWIIEQRGKPEVAKLTSETVIATGNEAVNSITSNIRQIDGMAYTAGRMVSHLPKQPSLINDSFQGLMSQADSRVVGGGLWYEPHAFNKEADEQAFVWQRDSTGTMKPNPRYQDINPTQPITPKNPALTPESLSNPYYRDWWYVPVMYATHDHCVWSRAYVQAESKLPIMTCARAITNARTNAFEGVVSLDIGLNRLQETVSEWQKKTGGYVFLVDMDNNFLTFPKMDEVKKVTANNPQGEMLNVNEYAKRYPSFAPVAQSLTKINQDLIAQVKQQEPSKFDFATNMLVSNTNLQKTTPDEAQIQVAMLRNDGQQDKTIATTHFVTQVAIAHDDLLNQPTTAFIFAMPMTNWKMVVVKPNQELMAFANGLGKQLQWSLLLGFIPMLLLSAYLLRLFAVVPLRRVAREVQAVGELIEQKRYLELDEHKLPPTSTTEVAVISDSMNQLIDRVVENEGTLAKINENLEQQVIERTEHLNHALTQLKTSQVQLVQAEKMATLGQMVAGVAHEVNTPLGYVKSNLSLIEGNLERYDDLVTATQQLKHQLAEQGMATDTPPSLQDTLTLSDEIVADELGEDLKALIDDAQFGVTQISELVVSLRDFSRIDQAKIKDVDINECIKNSLSMARSNIKYLNVITELNSTTPVHCNPSQINQVLLNLFNNASQAMPENHAGRLTVKSYEDDKNVYISVTDNGSGIPDDVKQHIFEPFFTTKKAGEGTGLGLAISAQIMEQHHGNISVQSTLGEGTTFILTLPKASQAQQQPKLAIAVE